MKFNKFLTLIFCVSILSGCDKFNGNTVTENVDISNTYKELCVYDAINVIISESIDEARITAGENHISDVVIAESGDRLEVRMNDGVHFITSNIKVELPYNPSMEKVTLSDASKIEGELNAEELTVNMSDASDATMQGHVERLIINLDGASKIMKNVIGNRYALTCDECEVSMSGASAAYIHCDGSIKIVKLKGASSLHYTGNAAISYSDELPSTGSSVKNDVL